MLLRGVVQDLRYAQSRDRILSMALRRVVWMACAGAVTRPSLTVFTCKIDPTRALRAE